MAGLGKVRERPSRHGRYFFLSYAQSPPLEGYPQAAPDQWVRKLFRDLTAAVRYHASPGYGLMPGFYDQEISIGSDWKASLSRALGAAEVFVPLYSPGYLARSWPGREWACFEERMRQAGLLDPLQRFAPVLWVPLSGQQDPPGLREALEADATVPEYAENGLRALLRLTPYHDYYTAVVDRLAKRIVTVAEGAPPLPPSEAPDIGQMMSPFLPEAALAAFVVTVAAPTLKSVPAGGDPSYYGESIAEWRPFPHQQRLPLADYAKAVAERLDFAVMITGIEKPGDLVTRWPGVILIDPWYIGDASRYDLLQEALSDLPPWVLPLLVPSSPGDARLGQLTQQVEGILQGSGPPRTAEVRRVPGAVSSLEDFVSAMPVLVAEAERQYLRHGPGARSGGQPGAAVWPAQSPGEAPDA